MPADPSCEACDLCWGAQRVCVWGERRGARPVGERPAVMVVGQNPGYYEDQVGRVFIGASGEWLTEGMRLAGIEDYYVTNAVKCFGDREPPLASVKACADYLDEEIAQVRPTHILALGAVAMRRLLGPGKITELQGKEIRSERYHATIMPLLHPAALMRSGQSKSAWLADVVRFGQLVRGTLPAQPPVTVHLLDRLGDLTDFVEWMRSDPGPFAYDFESKPGPDQLGLKWWHRDFEAYSIAFSVDGKTSYVVPLHHPESPYYGASLRRVFWERMRPVMAGATSKTAHNMLYDDLVWWREAGYSPSVTVDTAVLAHLLDENRSKRLKWLGRVLLNWPDWDIDSTKEHPLPELAYYNGCDAAATWQLRQHFLSELTQYPELQRYFSHLVLPYLHALRRMLWRGIHVNQDLARQRLVECAERIQAADAKVPIANPASFVQVGKWFYEELQLPVVKHTPGGRPSTDEETINTLALLGHPEAKLIIDCRQPRKQVSTYFLPALQEVSVSFDRRRHMNMNAATVETGRLSGGFHTTPRDPYVRSIYDAPEGWTLVQCDGSQIEARLVAWAAAGRPRTWAEVEPSSAHLLLAFHEGRDPYKEMAGTALRKPQAEVDTDERQRMGKVPTLSMLYDISWRGFQEYAWSEYEILYPDAEAQLLHRTFYALWPEIKRWHELEKRLLAAKGWTQHPLGRVRRLPAANSPDRKLAGDAQRAGINAPTQGLASDITQAALVLFEQLFSPERAFVVGDIHDALLAQVKNDYLPTYLTIIPHLFPQTVVKLQALGLFLPEGLIQSEVTVGPWGSKVLAQEWLDGYALDTARRLA
jgi:uracil-DNA glycosylase family 4